MRLIATKTSKSEWPKRHICDNCGAELEYEQADTHIGWTGCEYVTCPNCDRETPVSEERIMPPTWGITFFHTFATKGCLDICNQAVGEYIDKATKILCSDEAKPGEFYVTKVGNLLVVGLKWDDNVDIYVTKDYWEDTVMSEEYSIVK